MRIGVDIGGTGVRAAVVEDGVIRGTVRSVPLLDRTPARVVQVVADLARDLGASHLGVGMPGFVHRGVVLGSPNFPGWQNTDLQGQLRRATGVPVLVGNDANVAALGAWIERGRPGDLIVITLGTGVGGGVIVDGRSLVGARGAGAEIGHIPVGGSRRCGCGGLGCLETWCGTVGLIAAAAELGVTVDNGAAVVRAARAGEAWANQVLAQAAAALGRALVALVNLFNPEVIVIAGGLAAAQGALAPAVDWLQEHAIRPSAELVEVVWGGRADRWAILGAAALQEVSR